MSTNNVFICVPERDAAQLKISIPGLGELRSIKQTMDGVPTPEAAAMVMLGQISPALAPLTGILRIADVAVQILATFKAIPHAITSLDPSAITAAIAKLEKDIGFVTDFLPGAPYVRLTRDMLVMIEQILRGMSSLITRWITEMASISKAIESANILGDTGLSLSAYCSQKRLIEVQQGTQVSLQDVGQIIKIVKMIADIIRAVVHFDLPGISLIADELDTIAAVIPASPGDVSVAEQQRLLQVAHTMTELSDKIHNLVVLMTIYVG